MDNMKLTVDAPVVEPTNPEVPDVSVTLAGDTNCDGEISVADATLLLQYIGNKDKYNLTENGKANADVDGVAGISAVDALTIQMYDAGVVKELPVKK
ncbi:MAG: dockerin type I repeat-containing protein [Ruminococcus sp.]|nr:dockerin type I repeat-containing protein [Ruminococcus sp.]